MAVNWADLAMHVLTVIEDWRCSTRSGDYVCSGIRPVVPRQHIAGATSHTKAFPEGTTGRWGRGTRWSTPSRR